MKLKMIFFLLISVLWSVLSVSCLNVPTPFVKTHLGGIKGYYKKSAEGRQYAAYEGIPYALPPVGELRFQPPVPVPPWIKDISAVELPNACSQYDPFEYLAGNSGVYGVEDCLYLNIYTPAKNARESLPVIFWIHGGGFQYGTSSEYGAKFLMDRDLILVTMNYRVGPFGFLSTGDDVVPGNMGLKDQSLALRWVSENIKYFGGNPKKITLTGVSAGGASVHHHYLSPLSAGLFQNGISFSGTALARWAYLSDSSDRTKTLANALKCSTENSSIIVQCLRSHSAEKISTIVKELLSNLYFSYVFFPPVAEKIEQNYFINDSPRNIIESGKVHDIPWIAGVVSEEGLYITAEFALKEDMVAYTDKNWETIAPYMLHFHDTVPKNKHAQLVRLAKRHYFGNKPFSTDRNDVRNLTHLTGDDQIVTGAIRAAKLQASVNKSPVWFYYYSYRAAQSVSDSLSNTTENLGVSHDDDIYLVLENNVIDPTTTEKDRAMLQDMLNFWYSVASDGKPQLNTAWPKLNTKAKQFQYMNIAGPSNFTMQSNNNLGEILFWDSIGL